MDGQYLNRFRQALTKHRDVLLDWLYREAPPQTLERCCGPAAALAAPPGAEVIGAIETALDRLDHGTFGRCTLCEGEVETERLELDFTTCVCLDHYTEAQRRDLETDLELAARVQQHLFPRCMPALPGFEVAAHVRPARILSGDYYDFFFGGDGVQGMAIADVMGKGISAGMLMANLQASLRILGPEHDALDGLALRLNALFRYNLKLIRFITLCLLAIETETGRLRYCNAGHNPPLLWRAATGKAQWLKPTGPALGLMSEPSYHSETVPLERGDVLVLYTDGLVEARGASGAHFGEDRLVRYVAHHHAEPAEAILAGLHRTAARFADDHLHDDVALLVVKRA